MWLLVIHNAIIERIEAFQFGCHFFLLLCLLSLRYTQFKSSWTIATAEFYYRTYISDFRPFFCFTVRLTSIWKKKSKRWKKFHWINSHFHSIYSYCPLSIYVCVFEASVFFSTFLFDIFNFVAKRKDHDSQHFFSTLFKPFHSIPFVIKSNRAILFFSFSFRLMSYGKWLLIENDYSQFCEMKKKKYWNIASTLLLNWNLFDADLNSDCLEEKTAVSKK